jgi:hypothetical protein
LGCFQKIAELLLLTPPPKKLSFQSRSVDRSATAEKFEFPKLVFMLMLQPYDSTTPFIRFVNHIFMKKYSKQNFKSKFQNKIFISGAFGPKDVLKTTKVNLSMGQVCNYTSYAKSDLNQHSNSVQLGNNDFKCDNCDKAFSKKFDLNKNFNSVRLGMKDFKCDDCDKAFTRK